MKNKLALLSADQNLVVSYLPILPENYVISENKYLKNSIPTTKVAATTTNTNLPGK